MMKNGALRLNIPNRDQDRTNFKKSKNLKKLENIEFIKKRDNLKKRDGSSVAADSR